MRVGIIELAFHNEVLRSYIGVLKSIKVEVVCFTNQFCYDQLYDYRDDIQVDFVIKEEETNQKYFERAADSLKLCDRLIISTLDDELDFFSNYNWPSRTTLLVHDYFSYFETGKINFNGSVIEKAKAFKSLFKFLLNGEEKKTAKLISNMDSLALPSVHVLNFVDNKRKFEVLDFAVPGSKTKSNKSEKVKICIPGNVIAKSRNYRDVVKAFQLIKDKIQKPVELCILGQAKTNYGKSIIESLKGFESQYLKIYYFNSFIVQEEFDKEIKTAAFLLLPISPIMRYRHFKEQNGFSCVSGNINDMLYHGLPALLPSFYPLEKEMEAIAERYSSSKDLSFKLLNWINEGSYIKKYNNVEEVKEVMRHKIAERFQKALS